MKLLSRGKYVQWMPNDKAGRLFRKDFVQDALACQVALCTKLTCDFVAVNRKKQMRK